MRDKEYSVTKGKPDSKVLYFTANPNGEAEVVHVDLRPKPRLKKPSFDFEFSSLGIKGKNTVGVILTKYPIRKIEQRQEGISTLGSRKIWYDDTVKRLNTDERGTLLGDFSGPDKIITFTQSGYCRFTTFDLATHFEEDMIMILKYNPEQVYTAVYQDSDTRLLYLKRFMVELFRQESGFYRG